ncbi:hypothetical protein PR003_g21169 [Phytophthora rubi]|uniref:Uncharacterized protein n=1 Tax=Phytophthora rubi TaxID=129364 RepID=A0A6A3JCL0_9STRA|nr:hypothetical protein PR002_g20572 [Phytophthora rubi]KAE8995807.1 hypothetical protein PR001_g20027 [Phytophthora rubi]KAE9306746.1 hypothetical protein PR003_g21169 [Phytophthora rubi]
MVTRDVLEALVKSGMSVQISRVDDVKLSPVGGRAVGVSRVAIFKEVVLTSSAGPLMLRNLACYVEEENLSQNLTVGRSTIKILGYSTDKLLVDARSNKPEWEHGGSTPEKKAEPSQLQKMCRPQVEAREGTVVSDAEDDGDRHTTRTALPTMRPTNIAEVILYLQAKARVAD